MKILDAILVCGVRFYRWVLSPAKAAFFGPAGRCRFEPSCSEYALEAIQTHGAAVGSWLSLKRILRCHPWGGCGHDPVPPRQPWPTTKFRPHILRLTLRRASLPAPTQNNLSRIKG